MVEPNGDLFAEHPATTTVAARTLTTNTQIILVSGLILPEMAVQLINVLYVELLSILSS